MWDESLSNPNPIIVPRISFLEPVSIICHLLRKQKLSALKLCFQVMKLSTKARASGTCVSPVAHCPANARDGKIQGRRIRLANVVFIRMICAFDAVARYSVNARRTGSLDSLKIQNSTLLATLRSNCRSASCRQERWLRRQKRGAADRIGGSFGASLTGAATALSSAHAGVASNRDRSLGIYDRRS